MKLAFLLRVCVPAALLSLAASSSQAGLVGTTVSHCANTAYTGSVTTDTAACDSV